MRAIIEDFISYLWMFNLCGCAGAVKRAGLKRAIFEKEPFFGKKASGKNERETSERKLEEILWLSACRGSIPLTRIP